MHGRWDDCRVCIFKDITETKLRILTIQVGAEESIDQQTVDIASAELMPEVFIWNSPFGTKKIMLMKSYSMDTTKRIQSSTYGNIGPN